jgi:hypothetical protein
MQASDWVDVSGDIEKLTREVSQTSAVHYASTVTTEKKIEKRKKHVRSVRRRRARER